MIPILWIGYLLILIGYKICREIAGLSLGFYVNKPKINIKKPKISSEVFGVFLN